MEEKACVRRSVANWLHMFICCIMSLARKEWAISEKIRQHLILRKCEQAAGKVGGAWRMVTWAGQSGGDQVELWLASKEENRSVLNASLYLNTRHDICCQYSFPNSRKCFISNVCTTILLTSSSLHKNQWQKNKSWARIDSVQKLCCCSLRPNSLAGGEAGYLHIQRFLDLHSDHTKNWMFVKQTNKKASTLKNPNIPQHPHQWKNFSWFVAIKSTSQNIKVQESSLIQFTLHSSELPICAGDVRKEGSVK